MGPKPAAFCKKCGADRRFIADKWRCRPCMNASQAAWRARQSPETLARYNAARTASRRNWSAERRAAVNARTAKWREANRAAHRAGSRDWYRRNAQRVLAGKSDYYRVNVEAFLARNLVRKARLRAAVCEHGTACVDRDFLIGVYTSECVYCGSAAEHADHYVPLAAGGRHCRENIVPACAPCNQSKHATDPELWVERRSSA